MKRSPCDYQVNPLVGEDSSVSFQKNGKVMEPELQQQEQINVTLPEGLAALQATEPGTLATLTPTEPDEEGQQIGRQATHFLEQLPTYIGTFFQEYKLPIISFGLLVTGVTALRISQALLNALDDVPLLPPTFKLIGVAYMTWLTLRYLVKASTRQELAAELGWTKKEIMEGKISDSLE